MSKNFSSKVLCKSIMVIFLVLYAGCAGSVYKKGAVIFNDATLPTLKGYERIIEEYEKQGVILKARSVQGSRITREDDLRNALKIDAAEWIAFRRFLLEALKTYTEALSALASVGSAEEVKNSFLNLGSKLDKLGIDKAKSASKTVGSLAKTFIDTHVKAKIRKRIVQADPEIQEIIGTLSRELKLFKSSMKIEYSSEWNMLRAELQEKSKSVQGFADSLEKVRLLLQMQKQLLKKEKIPELVDLILKSLEKMSRAHAVLARKAGRTKKSAILKELNVYLNRAKDVEALLDELDI